MALFVGALQRWLSSIEGGHRSYLCGEVKWRIEILDFLIFWSMTKYPNSGRTARRYRYLEKLSEKV